MVRAARLHDAMGIAHVHVESWRSSHRGLVPDAMMDDLDVEARAVSWEERMRGGAITYVAEEDGVIVGFASAGPAREWEGPQTAELYAIYLVDAAQRRRGGTEMMRILCERLVREGHAGMMLWVLAANAPARAFYEWLGGRTVDTRTDWMGLDEVAYAWDDLRALVAHALSEGVFPSSR